MNACNVSGFLDCKNTLSKSWTIFRWDHPQGCSVKLGIDPVYTQHRHQLRAEITQGLHAEPMLNLLSQIVRTPTFPESEVVLAKANALPSLKAAEAQPGFRAARSFRATRDVRQSRVVARVQRQRNPGSAWHRYSKIPDYAAASSGLRRVSAADLS